MYLCLDVRLQVFSIQMNMKKVKISGEHEYNALREEILKRIELSIQLIGANFTIVAAFLAFGVNNNPVVLCLPITSMLIAMVYINNSYYIQTISRFISDKYQVENEEIDWESYVNEQKRNAVRSIHRLSVLIGAPAIFIISSIVALTVGMINYGHTMLEKVLMVLGFIAVLVTVVNFYLHMKVYRS